jgi:hypothetical protein
LQTITTSSAVTIHPSPTISTFSSSSCITFHAARSSSSLASEDVAGTETTQQGGWRAGRFNNANFIKSFASTTAATGSSTPASRGLNALELHAVPSDSLSSDASVAIPASISSLSRQNAPEIPTTWAVGSPLRFTPISSSPSASSAPASSSLAGPHLKPNLPTPRALPIDRVVARQDDQCASWTTTWSVTTIYPDPTVSWMSDTVTLTSVQTASAAVETLYATCDLKESDESVNHASSMVVSNTEQGPGMSHTLSLCYTGAC